MKKMLFIIALIASIFVINNLVREVYSLWKKQKLLTQAQQELLRERGKNQRLKSQLFSVSNNKFIESEARNKLFLLRPNEKVIILKDLKETTVSASIKDTRPNWKKWMALFF